MSCYETKKTVSFLFIPHLFDIFYSSFYFRSDTMNQTLNITDHLLIHNKPGYYLIDSVDEDIEVFVRFADTFLWAGFGALQIIVNLTIFLAIFKVNRAQRIYYLVQVSCIFKIMIGSIYLFLNDIACVYCKSNLYNSLFVSILKSFITTKAGDILALVIGSSECLITLDRLSILRPNLARNFFKKQDIKCIIPLIILISLLIHIPDFFIFDFIKLGEDLYYREKNSFIDTSLYKFVCAPIMILSTLTLMVTYLTLVFLLVKSYNGFLQKKKTLRTRNSRVNAHENDLIKMIIFQSGFNCIAALFGVISQVINKLEFNIKFQNPTDYYRGDLIIVRTICFIISLFFLAISDTALFLYDSRIKQLFMFCKKPVANNAANKSSTNQGQQSGTTQLTNNRRNTNLAQ